MDLEKVQDGATVLRQSSGALCGARIWAIWIHDEKDLLVLAHGVSHAKSLYVGATSMT
jgi:hypothetical protein